MNRIDIRVVEVGGGVLMVYVRGRENCRPVANHLDYVGSLPAATTLVAAMLDRLK